MVIQILNYVVGANVTEMNNYVIKRYVSPHFGASAGDPRYDARADVNKDGVIDSTDLGTFAADPALTFKTFGVTPLYWYQVALPVGVSLLVIGAIFLVYKRR